MSFSECVLDDDVTGAIFDFFEPEDLVSMAITCRHNRFQVESYAKNVYEKLLEAIAKSLNVDSNWRRRLQEHEDRTRSRTYRHRLRCIRQVHLYTFRTRTKCTILPLSERKTLLLVNAAGILEELNLQTPPQQVRVFNGTHSHRPLSALRLCGKYIVSCDHCYVKVWNMEGNCIHTVPFDQAHMMSGKLIATCSDDDSKLYYPSLDEQHWCISEMDILQGRNTRLVQLIWSDDFGFPQQLLCCGRWLLVLYECNHGDQGGIHVLNRTELKKESYFKGSFLCMATSDDGSCVAAAARDGAVLIMRIDNGGTLQVLHSVPFAQQGLTSMKSLLVLRNKIYLLCGQVLELEQIHVVDASTGKFLRQLYYPEQDNDEVLRPRELTTDGHNVYCRFFGTRGHVGSFLLMAYPG